MILLNRIYLWYLFHFLPLYQLKMLKAWWWCICKKMQCHNLFIANQPYVWMRWKFLERHSKSCGWLK